MSGERWPLRRDNVFLVPPPGATELLSMPAWIAQLSATIAAVVLEQLLAVLSYR